MLELRAFGVSACSVLYTEVGVFSFKGLVVRLFGSGFRFRELGICVCTLTARGVNQG